MKNNSMLKKVLKVISLLALCFTVTYIDARPMSSKGSSQSRGAQRRTPQGRYAVRTRQQRASKATNQQIIPTEVPVTTSVPANQPAAQTSQQSAPTNVDVQAAQWRAVKRLLLNKKESPSQALAMVKKIRTKTLAEDQEEWLDMFEGWMVLAMLQKSGQLVDTGSAGKTKQQGALLQQPIAQVSESIDAQKWEQIKDFLNEKVKAGLSSKALEYIQYIREKYIQEKPLMFSKEQQNWLNEFEQNVKRAEKPVASSQPNQPQQGSQTALGQLWESVPSPYDFVGVYDPNLRSKPTVQAPKIEPAPVAVVSQTNGGGPSATVEDPTPTTQVPAAQPRRQGPQTAFGQLWESVPSPYDFVGVYDPNLRSSGSTAQVSVTAPQPAGTMTKENWESLQRSLNKAALLPSQDLLPRIEKIKRSYPFNDEQKKYFDQLEEKVKAALESVPALAESISMAQGTVAQPRPGSGLSEQEWKSLMVLLTQAAEHPSQELLNDIEKIKKNPVLNNEQRERLEGFQQTMEALIPQ